MIGRAAWPVRRSWLLVASDDPVALRAACAAPADVLVLGHTGHGARSGRDATATIEGALATAHSAGAEVFVGLHPDWAHEGLPDLPGVAGIVVEAEEPGDVADAGRLVSDHSARVRSPSPLELVVSLPTARANQHAFEIAIAAPTRYLTLGRADVDMDLRPEPSGEIHLLTHLMQRLAVAARAAGCAPLGARWRAPARGLRAGARPSEAAARRAFRLGFRGSWCAHPSQAGALNRGFTPQRSDLERARRTLVREATSTDDRVVAAAHRARSLLELADSVAAHEARRSASTDHGPRPRP